MTDTLTADDLAVARELRAELGWDERAKATPEQLSAFLRRCPEPIAVAMCQKMLASADQASDCFAYDHEGQLTELRYQVDRLREQGTA